MSDDRELSPLAHNLRREASASIAGTHFHVWRAIQEWLSLAKDDELFLEGAEDIDTFQRGETTLFQLRRTVSPISLNTQKVVEALANFWEHVQKNPDRDIQYRYCTTAGIAHEQGLPLDDDRAGLELWALIRKSDDAGIWTPLVITIANFLKAKPGLPQSMRDFLDTASPSELKECIFDRVSFETWSDDTDEIAQEVRRSVIKYGRDLGIEPVFSTRAIPALVNRTLEALVDPRFRRLEYVDFEDVFSHAVSFPVMPGQLVVGLTDVGERLVIGIEDVLRSIVPLNERHQRRLILSQKLGDALSNHTTAYIAGSSGKGKTQLASEFVSTSDLQWKAIDLRNIDDIGIGRMLRAALLQLKRLESLPSLIIDDFNAKDSQSAARALQDVVDACAGAGQKVIITSYDPPAKHVRDALRLSNEGTVQIENFDESEIQVLLAARGAPAERIGALTSLVLMQTGGHPTLVDARADALQHENFEMPPLEAILETPPEVLDEFDRVRKFSQTLPTADLSVLYRASLSNKPLKRDQLVRLAAAEIPPEGVVPKAGATLDGLVGPWFEIDHSSGRYRLSELLRGLAQWGTDPAWVSSARHALVNALLKSETVDIDDALEALLQALSSDYVSAVISILSNLISEVDPSRLSMLAAMAPWLTGVGVGVAPLDMFQLPGLAALLRVIQYRVAATTEDARTANRIARQFEVDPRFEEARLLEDLMFYGTAITKPVEDGATIMNYASRFLDAATSSSAQTPQLQEVIASFSEGNGDLVEWLGSIVFGTVRELSDLKAIIEELATRDRAFARRFLAWFDEATIAWRGVAATITAAEADEDVPRFECLCETLVSFSELLRSLELSIFANDVIVSAATIRAERLGDVAGADSLIDGTEQAYGSNARLGRARAIARHAAGEWADALELFRRSFAELDRDPDDLELPLDMRLAANAAGNLHLFDDARDLLLSAAGYMTSTRQPSMSAGLLADAAYCSWRSGRDEEAFEGMCITIDRLAGCGLSESDPRFQNTLRRLMYLLTLMDTRSGNEVEIEEQLPAVGFASNVDPLPDVRPDIAIGLVYSLLGLMEQRVTGGTKIVDERFSAMEGAGGPGAGLGIVLKLNAIALRGDLPALVKSIAELQRSARVIAKEFAAEGSVDAAALGRPYIVLTMLSFGANNALDSETLLGLSGAAQAIDLPNVARAFLDSLRLLADPHAAAKILETGGDDDNERLLAAAIISSVPTAGPDLRFLAQQAQVALLGPAHRQMPVYQIILTAAKANWLEIIDQDVFFKNSPASRRHSLRMALQDDSGSPSAQLLRIFLALCEATEMTFHPLVREYLEGAQ